MFFWKKTQKKLEEVFVKEVGNYALNIRMDKKKVGEYSIAFEKRMQLFKKEVRSILENTQKKERQTKLEALLLATEEYIQLSKHAKKTVTGNDSSQKKIEQHQQQAMVYFRQFTKK